MRSVFGLVLIAGLGLAGLAVYMVQNYVSEYQSALRQEQENRKKIVPTKDVIVADQPMEYGEALSPRNVRLVKWPEDAIPEGAFTDVTALFPNNNEEPRYIIRRMEKDEAILAVKVTNPGEDAGITSRLAKGMRAFTITVDASTGVSGFIRPDDRVDIYWTGRINSETASGARNDVTKLIDTNVQIIAIDQSANSDRISARVARTVTVAIHPNQVAALAQAQSTGRLSLSLVGVGDQTTADSIEVDQTRLLGLVEKAPERAPAEQQVCTIRQRRGAEVIEIPIPCSD